MSLVLFSKSLNPTLGKIKLFLFFHLVLPHGQAIKTAILHPVFLKSSNPSAKTRTPSIREAHLGNYFQVRLENLLYKGKLRIVPRKINTINGLSLIHISEPTRRTP